MPTVEHITLTQEEIRKELDDAAQRVLGLDVDEFLERYRAGELDADDPTVLRLTILARLLADAEPHAGDNGHRS
jgi:hypothetical protein